MNDDLPDLDPAGTERVRRLLAEARHTDPVPADVAARLDRTLESLSEERRELESRTVVTLASRRRRRATQLLVAAVAVVAVGIGFGRLVSGMEGLSSDGGSGTAADSGGSASRSDSGGDSLADADGEAAEESAPEPSAEAPGAASEPDRAKARLIDLPLVEDATFDADAADARASEPSYDLGATGNDATVDSCEREAWGQGRRVLVRYQGARAALVFRGVADGSQVVDLFACDADLALRTGSVPAP